MSTALITGASRGLGREIARSLADDGWHLVVDARGTDALRDTADELRGLGTGTVLALPGDVADPAHRNVLVASVETLGGGLDLLVNNASRLGPSPQPLLADYPLEVFDQVYAVNVAAPLALTQRLLPALRRRRGTVVNMSSDAAREPYDGWGGYGSSKAALDQLTAILGAEETDLRVYAFDPGDMRTTMHQEAFPGEDISDRPLPATVIPAFGALLVGTLPSGRYAAADLLTTATSASPASIGGAA